MNLPTPIILLTPLQFKPQKAITASLNRNAETYETFLIYDRNKYITKKKSFRKTEKGKSH